ncbi:ankyrin repeat domain-containing protein [Methylobacterium sp. WL7]|nr:ankyrin repeat domain-containing protein [Methylobacterium sp. WL7]
MSVVWDGITARHVLGVGHVAIRHEMADAAKGYAWTKVLSLLEAHPSLVNTTRPDGTSLYAPLHQAAHGNAPREICEALIRMGAWRMLENARGERPVDLANRLGHERVAAILEPVQLACAPFGVLRKIQTHFHAVILERAADLVRDKALRLPEIGHLLEVGVDAEPTWFAVPGMYGGFSYRLAADGVDARLVAESWCRVVEGSGQRHEITSAGARLVDEGFV